MGSEMCIRDSLRTSNRRCNPVVYEVVLSGDVGSHVSWGKPSEQVISRFFVQLVNFEGGGDADKPIPNARWIERSCC